MKREIKKIIIITFLILPVLLLNAGNEDRSGQAGASELLINPWARGAGWGNVGVANARGVESMFLNVSGITFTKKTELSFMNTQWLRGSGITINAFGLTQRVSSSGVIGLSVTSMSFGKMNITTVDNPEGGIGTYQPSFLNVGVSYAHSFSDAIHGGVTLKIINESISDLNAFGSAIDAGIQYVTGEFNHIRFGVTLKNIGTPMSFKGDGLSVRGVINGSENNITTEQRSAQFELPSLLSIGGAYDFLWMKEGSEEEKSAETVEHRVTIAGNFVSNAFTKDQYILGVEYAWNNMLQIRSGYNYESDILNKDDNKTAFTGFNCGLSVQVPVSKEKGSKFSIDYAFKSTRNFKGCHTIGAIFSF